MTLKEQEKLAHNIMRLLKVRYVSFPIALTEKGQVFMKYVKETDRYQIVVDAVPLDLTEYDNKELKSVMEKYLFEQEDYTRSTFDIITPQMSSPLVVLTPDVFDEVTQPKKKGRPAKSK